MKNAAINDHCEMSKENAKFINSSYNQRRIQDFPDGGGRGTRHRGRCLVNYSKRKLHEKYLAPFSVSPVLNI